MEGSDPFSPHNPTFGNDPLLNSPGLGGHPRPDVGFKLYKQRFYVLAVFSLFTFLQGMCSATVLCSTKHATLTSDDLNLLQYWSPVVSAVLIIPAVLAVNINDYGPRRAVIGSAILLLLCSFLRLTPYWLGPGSVSNHKYFLHVGQLVGDLAGPVAMILPPVMSGLWFGEKERHRATALSLGSRQIGIAAGFSLGFLFNSSAFPKFSDSLHAVLLVELAVALVLTVVVLLYFPRMPPSFPSAFAQKSAAIQGKIPLAQWSPALSTEGVQVSLRGWAGVKLCFWTRSFVCLSLAGGLSTAVSTWWALRGQMALTVGGLTPPSGSGSTLSHCTDQGPWSPHLEALSYLYLASGLGSWLAGVLVDCTGYILRRPRVVLLALLASNTVVFLWLSLTLPALGRSAPLIPGLMDWASADFTCGVVAFALLGMAMPVFYETGVGLLYPLPEANSAGLFNQWNCLILLIFMVSGLEGSAANIAACAASACSLLLVVVGVRGNFESPEQDNSAFAHNGAGLAFTSAFNAIKSGGRGGDSDMDGSFIEDGGVFVDVQDSDLDDSHEHGGTPPHENQLRYIANSPRTGFSML